MAVELQRRDGGAWGAANSTLTWLGFFLLMAWTIAGRWLRAPPLWVVGPITFLPYFYLAAVVWCSAIWIILPDRKTPPSVLTLLILVSLSLWGPSFYRGTPPVDGTKVKVLSWNVRRLWGGPDDGGQPAQCVIETLREEQPDILALQEISRLDLDALQRALPLRCVHTSYQRSTNPKHGGLAACVFSDSWRLRYGQGQRFVDTEDWSYVFAEFERDNRIFNLLTVHLEPYRGAKSGPRSWFSFAAWQALGASSKGVVQGQYAQSAALLHRAQRFHDPTIIAGDFNSTRDSALHVSLRQHLNDTFEAAGKGLGATISIGDWAPLRVDYIYASDSFYVQSSRVPQTGCSDHQPVISELVLP